MVVIVEMLLNFNFFWYLDWVYFIFIEKKKF